LSPRDVAMMVVEVLKGLASERGLPVVAEVSEGGTSIKLSLGGLSGLVEVSCGGSPNVTHRVHEAVSKLLADFGVALRVGCCSSLGSGDELRFDAKVVVAEPLKSYLVDYLKASCFLVGDDEWVRGIPLKEIARLVESVYTAIREESWLARYTAEIEQQVQEFTDDLASSGHSPTFLQKLHEALGGVGTAPLSHELVYTQVALVLILAAALCERAKPGFLACELGRHGHNLRRLWTALEDISRAADLPLVGTAASILKVLPANASESAVRLLELGSRLAKSTHLLARDMVGRIYARVIGGLATRKGLATYFTEAPASYLLSYLAVADLLELDSRNPTEAPNRPFEDLAKRVCSVKVGDLACGSGTLLIATYSTFLRVMAGIAPYRKLEEVDLRDLGRRVAESGLCCVDAVDLTSRIASANIALASPSDLPRVATFTIPLGEREGAIYLGSLELVQDIRDRPALPKVAASLPDLFDLVIMNPPFTRATGRGRRLWREERGFLGFVGDERVRSELIGRLRRLRDYVRRSLLVEALSVRQELPRWAVDMLEGREEDLDQYLGIGLAGMGLLFLYLAYQRVKPGGVIAFVLPRNLLSGVSWFLARTLLASRFHLRYVVVSSDSEGGYNFSDGAHLSEVLVVARRVEQHSDDEGTVFVNLLRKPRTAVEALDLAVRLSSGGYSELSAGCVTRVIGRRELMENIDNWNRFVALPEPGLVDLALELLGSGTIRIGGSVLEVPVTRLRDIVSTIGVNSPQFHESFSVVSGQTRYPSIYGGREHVRSAMYVEPNAYLEPKSEAGERLFERYSGRVLLPDRIWWDTAHYIAHLSARPVLSNVFYVARLREVEDVPTETLEKVIVFWLNTTWGILSILTNRQETRGRWTRLKIGQWRLLPVLNVAALNHTTLHEIAKAFDQLVEASKKATIRRLPDQFDPEDPDPLRVEIDVKFLTAIDPSLRPDHLKDSLLDLYAKLGRAMRIWIGPHSRTRYRPS